MKKICVALVCLLLLNACKKEDTLTPLPPTSATPTLTFPLVSFASTRKFVAFGDTLSNQTINKGYEFVLADTVQNYTAACSGIITGITPGSNGNNSIAVKYKVNSAYSFVYDGVRNIQVHVNDSINPGTVLGKVAHNGIIDFKLIKNGNTVVCPESYSSDGFSSSIQEAIVKHNLYNPGDSIGMPCKASTLPE